MSQHSYDITCPQCGHTGVVDLYEAIDASMYPDLKAALLENRLNTVTCNQCGFEFRVDKPLLYHDADEGFIIYWIPIDEQEIQQHQDEFRKSLDALADALPEEYEPPDVHLVTSRVELIERIFFLEAGLNERILEYIKYMIYSQNIEKTPPESKHILFNAEDSTDENLCFVVMDRESNRLESTLQYDRSAYDALYEMFDRDEHTPDLLEMFPGPYISARALMLQQGPQ